MLVIAGAAGRTGLAAAQALAEARAPLRVLVRAQWRVGPWTDDGIEARVADLTSPGQLGAALQGARGAYLFLPTPELEDEAPQETLARMVDALAAAVAQSSLEHVVLLSCLAVGGSGAAGVAEPLRALEQRLRQGRVPTTVLRAGWFLENWSGFFTPRGIGGDLVSFLPDQLRLPMVSATDVGQLAARLLLEGHRPERPIVEVHGPADQSPADVAALLSQLLGRTVGIDTVEPGQLEGWLADRRRPAQTARLLAAFYRTMASAPSGVLPVVRGKVSLEEWLTAYVRLTR